MLAHKDIWRAIDALAASRHLSVSGLARRAGLDATAFNRSKRISRNGKQRWPSTESLAKVLAAADATLDEFAGLVERRPAPRTNGSINVPVISLTAAATADCFDIDGRPKSHRWSELAFPSNGDAPIYALDISGDGLEPVYKAGDTILVSAAATARRGDRVVVKMTGGEVVLATMGRSSNEHIELHLIGSERAVHSYPVGDVAWISRIIWAAQ